MSVAVVPERATSEPIGLAEGFHRDPALVAAGYRWHVLHTRSRHEKAIAEVMDGVGAKAYVPLFKRVVYYGHRKRVVETPLFSCYVFLWGTLDHAYLGTSTKRVANIIEVPDQARLERELTQLSRATQLGAPLSPYAFLVKGRRVRVTAGPFEGLEGLVEDPARMNRLILQVHAIGRSLSLEIDASLLEPMD